MFVLFAATTIIAVPRYTHIWHPLFVPRSRMQTFLLSITSYATFFFYDLSTCSHSDFFFFQNSHTTLTYGHA